LGIRPGSDKRLAAGRPAARSTEWWLGWTPNPFVATPVVLGDPLRERSQGIIDGGIGDQARGGEPGVERLLFLHERHRGILLGPAGVPRYPVRASRAARGFIGSSLEAGRARLVLSRDGLMVGGEGLEPPTSSV
jgi:hypothetical protein